MTRSLQLIKQEVQLLHLRRLKCISLNEPIKLPHQLVILRHTNTIQVIPHNLNILILLHLRTTSFIWVPHRQYPPEDIFKSVNCENGALR